MPFTLAHPAAAVPLLRVLGKFGGLSALVIGSIVPDLHRIFHVGRSLTHSLSGVFAVDLPAGLFCYLLFHFFLKRPLCALFPEELAFRLAPLAEISLPAIPWSGVLLSLLAGSLTHVGWDALTHGDTFGFPFLGFLDKPLFFSLSFSDLLQAGSSVLGVWLLLAWFGKWLAHAERKVPGFPLTDGKVTILLAFSALPCAIFSANGGGGLLNVVSAPIAAWLNAMAYAITAYAAVWHFRGRKK